MLEDLLSHPTWRLENSVNIRNLLCLSSRLIIQIEPKAFTQALFLILKDNCIFFDKRDLSLMSRTAITYKFIMSCFLNEGRY